MVEKTKKKARKPPESAARIFRAVAQCDFSGQMDVVRWLLGDPLYQLVGIKHDRDIYTADEIQEQITKRNQSVGDYYTRTNGDGSQSQFRAGDLKPPHIHLLIRTTAKMRESTLSARFSSQLHFQAVADAPHCARYLLHRTFDSRNKAQYEWDELFFSDPCKADSEEWYNSLYGGFAHGTCDVVGRVQLVREAVAALRESGEISPERTDDQALCDELVRIGDSEAIGSLMAHAFFYKTFT